LGTKILNQGFEKQFFVLFPRNEKVVIHSKFILSRILLARYVDGPCKLQAFNLTLPNNSITSQKTTNEKDYLLHVYCAYGDLRRFCTS
jgi:hypothetical protein